MVAGVNLGAHTNSLPNLLRALNERVYNVVVNGELKPTPKPADGAWDRMVEHGKLLSRFVLERKPHVKRLTCEEFILQCPSHKRALYTTAANELATRGWDQRDTRIKAFVKFEKIKMPLDGPKSDPVPRLIQPRAPVYNVALGRYTRAVEGDLYDAIAAAWGVDDGEKVVMKGLTVEEVASQLRVKWDHFHQPCAIGLDASRFDQHVSKQALQWEHRVYKAIFERDPELAALLSFQLTNHGVANVDGVKVNYKTHGCRMSGDMNTSLGNCMIMSMLVLLYCKERKVHVKYANNGDDCLVFMDRRTVATFSQGLAEWFQDFGFTMTIEDVVYVFERCEFCQTRPVNNGHEWVMCRIPQVAVSKDVMGLACKNIVEYRRWIHAVGTGGFSLYGDMPIYGALYTRLREQGVQSKIGKSLLYSDSGFARMSLKPRRHVSRCVTDTCRLSFWRAFGIPPDLQLEVEQACANANFSSTVVDDPGVGDRLAIITTDHLGN